MGSKNYVCDILNLNFKIINFFVIVVGYGYVDFVIGKDFVIELFSKVELKGIFVWLIEISDFMESYDVIMISGLKWVKKFYCFLCEVNIGVIVWWVGVILDGGIIEGLINIEKNCVDYEVIKCCEVFGNFFCYIFVGSKCILV